MIKAIIFDWGDTLSSGIPEGHFPREKIKRELGLEAKKIDFCFRMMDEIKVPDHSKDPGTIGKEKEFWKIYWGLMADRAGIKNKESFVNYLLQWNFKRTIPLLFEEVPKIINLLFQKKFKLAILSNAWPSRLLEIQRTGIDKYFPAILISSIIGVRKPDPEAYKIAMKKIGESAEEILFLDNKEDYLLPAQELGMKVVFVDRIDWNPNSQFPRIKDLSEITNYL